MFPFLVPGRVGYDAGRAHHQHSKQDQINIATAIVLTGLVVSQCYRGSVYVQHSTQCYNDPQFLGYVEHMSNVLERKLKCKARKMKLRKKAPPKRGKKTPGHPSCVSIIRREGDHEMSVIPLCNRNKIAV